MIGARASMPLAVVFVTFFTAGCLPFGYGVSAGGLGGASIEPSPRPRPSTRADVGGEASAHLYPQGTRGLAVTADFAGSGGAGGAYRTGLGVGYAHIPPPYESPWGYEVVARAALGNVPGETSAAFHTGARMALLFRPGQSDTVWHQDREPTHIVWYVGPFVIVDPAFPLAGGDAWVDLVAGVAVHALHYDIGAP